ncbi:putative mannitol-1-phosphate dehydrogenase protein [Lasiodiplodia theobromae]|nr:Mannitol 1-phosphate dehydrogenase [Lasiodiplodia theobromae]KAF4540285.1 Mannitol 1-phosphate dehydrogenase [Lasiodiplodia theobromae]KAF9637083.1 putative mannitol-1-phosphate dehydrogenase protein [Lasiodiplodia theobromae]
MSKYEKKAVHFGGGNIGRGFVAEFLHKSGYEVIFVDVMDKIIDALNSTKSYTVTEIGDDGEKTFQIDHYRALNSKYKLDQVIEEIATADVVTCAVGPNILKFIAEPVAKGIETRKLDYPLAVIACENAINATNTWRGFIEERLSDETKQNIDSKARFANSAIDRIVPHQDPDAGLNVKIEKFFEWCVELPPFEGVQHPEIDGVHFVDHLEPYIERKLYTVNTSHASAAYYGYNRNKRLIHDSMHDNEIHDIVRDCLRETARLIVKKHGISAEEQNDYVEKIVKRISNPALEDDVRRVGRAPLRKLSRKERFIGPASQLAEMGESFENLLGAAEMALRFQNVEGDDESFELAKILKDNNAKEATMQITGLEESHPLFPHILKKVEKVQSSSKL